MELIVIIVTLLGAIIFLLGISCYLFGFTPVGVAANSCAACCQSIIGNVVKGSCFAIMTCLAMRGCFIALIILGLLVLAGVGIYFMVNSDWFRGICDWIQNITSMSKMPNIKGFLGK